MLRAATLPLFLLIVLSAAGAGPVTAQVMDGSLRVIIRDPDGGAVAAQVEITGRSPEFRAEAQADSQGQARLTRLPPGIYRLWVKQPGFEEYSEVVEIRSAVPQERLVMLRLAAVATEITVLEPAPLLDVSTPALVMQASRQQLDETLGTGLGRSTIDVITMMPGWLLEANAVLHPRGSEYDTQYVVDGMPLLDNRSIGFAPAFENTEFEAVNIMTGGIPAEYGRRLGGVIVLDTRRAGSQRYRTETNFQTGSFGTRMGSLTLQRRAEPTTLSLGLHGGQSSRYLDPPSIENFTNKSSAGGFNVRLEQDLTDRDRLTFYLRSNRTRFMVPNDLVQQAAGQRQDRMSSETAGQVHYQHTFSSHMLGSLRGMLRDLTAELWSNTFATPVYVDQDRGLREGAFIGDLTIETERHTLKLGGDVRINRIRERFRFAEADELPEFDLDFQERRRNTDTAIFAQDHLRYRNFAATFGLRLDHHRLVETSTALSPRAGASYWVPGANLLIRASYDRIFQPPPIENILLSNAAVGLEIDDVEGGLTVPPTRANFYEVGFRKPVADILRLDVSHYWRTFRNYLDDDVFLNTGLSFPVTFDSARVEGTEIRLEMPRWRAISSTISYSNMLGRATSPVTGGLFVEGGEAEEFRDVVRTIAISQDQRNTVAGQVRVEPHRRVWFVTGARYGSGLPVELDDDDDDDDNGAVAQPISQVVLDKVDFERGRVRPNFSLDLGMGLRLWEHDTRSVATQFDVRNITDRFNVINFSGVFSGTALAPGRQITFKTKVQF